MIQVLQASQLTLHDVETKFGLQSVRDTDFFPEWQISTPKLTEAETYWLDKTQTDFIYLAKYPVHEELVKMVVLSPLLSVAGFYQQPFRPIAEKTVEVEVEANEEVLRGRIDILGLNQQLWVIVVEAKSTQFSWHLGLPQALTYMMGGQQPSQVRFGLITNGTDLIFIKLQRDRLQYGLSKIFSLFNPGNELYDVVGVLRALSQP